MRRIFAIFSLFMFVGSALGQEIRIPQVWEIEIPHKQPPLTRALPLPQQTPVRDEGPKWVLIALGAGLVAGGAFLAIDSNDTHEATVCDTSGPVQSCLTAPVESRNNAKLGAGIGLIGGGATILLFGLK